MAANSPCLNWQASKRDRRLKLLEKVERAIPRVLIYLVADNLKTHKSAMVREWLEKHPTIEHAFIPKGAAWLNLIEVWWLSSGPAKSRPGETLRGSHSSIADPAGR